MPTPTDQFARHLRLFSEEFMGPFSEGDLGVLTKQEVRAVSLVARGVPVRMGDVAAALGVVQSAVTALVDRLERAGLVARTRGEADRRVWLVEATEAGRRIAEAEAEAYRALAAGLLAPLSPDERETLAVLLGRVVDGIEPSGRAG